MKKQTKTIILSIALCMIFALGVFCVYAVQNFSFNAGGSIKFIAPGINATISNATLTGISKESGSGQMSEFTITPSMTEEQIQALDGYKSWTGLKLLFDENSDGKAKLSFDITNNSSKDIENIMVELSTNTSHSSPVVVTPSADFCVAPGQSHTFNLVLLVQNVDQSANIDDFELVVELGIIKPDQVLSQAEHKQTTGLNFTTNSSARTAVFSKYTTPTGATALADGLEVEIPAVIKDTNGNLYTVTEIKDGSGSSSSAFYSVKTTLTKITMPNTLTKIGNYAFYSCTALTGNLVIPSSVTSIGREAFSGCSGLVSVEIPSGVTSIGNYAFEDCSKLTSITVSATTPPTLGGTSCFDNTNNCNIYVPAESVETYKTATKWSSYASRIFAIA